MSSSVKTMQELTDSRILFEKKLPPFGYIIVWIVLLACAGIIIWSTQAHKAYEIIATGTVTSNEANYVMSAYTGTILHSDMEEGKIVSQGDRLFVISSTEYDLQSKQLKETRRSYEEKRAQYEKLVHSIQDDQNYFSATDADDALYYSAYESYKAQVTQNHIDTSAYKSYGYTDEQIEVEIEKNAAKITELYHAAIQSAENSIAECETQLDAIDAQLSALQSGYEGYTITATTNGTLHLLADYKEGMVVQTGSAIATITPENSDTLVEAYVTPADMARMHTGDTVEMEIGGLMQSVYGTISGEVVQISSNVTAQETQNGTVQMFKIQIRPDSLYVVSNSGNKVNLSNGMTAEARIHYDEVTYFDYVMDKLGFKAK